MKLFVLIALLACSGCSVTMTGSAKWSDPEPLQSELEQLRQRNEQFTTAIQNMKQELQATTNDINAVSAVLRKYGIQVGGK